MSFFVLMDQFYLLFKSLILIQHLLICLRFSLGIFVSLDFVHNYMVPCNSFQFTGKKIHIYQTFTRVNIHNHFNIVWTTYIRIRKHKEILPSESLWEISDLHWSHSEDNLNSLVIIDQRYLKSKRDLVVSNYMYAYIVTIVFVL